MRGWEMRKKTKVFRTASSLLREFIMTKIARMNQMSKPTAKYWKEVSSRNGIILNTPTRRPVAIEKMMRRGQVRCIPPKILPRNVFISIV